MTATYDEVLNCPDTHCRKKALDLLCKEKIAEGIRKAASLVVDPPRYLQMNDMFEARLIRAAKDLEDS